MQASVSAPSAGWLTRLERVSYAQALVWLELLVRGEWWQFGFEWYSGTGDGMLMFCGRMNAQDDPLSPVHGYCMSCGYWHRRALFHLGCITRG